MELWDNVGFFMEKCESCFLILSFSSLNKSSVGSISSSDGVSKNSVQKMSLLNFVHGGSIGNAGS